MDRLKLSIGVRKSIVQFNWGQCQTVWAVNRTKGKSPFIVVYGRNLIIHLDLVLVLKVGLFSEEGTDQSKQIKELHRKLKPRKDGPFHVIKKINDNGYKIETPGHYNVSATFNVADLFPYTGDSDDEPDSWSSLFQEGEDDAFAVNDRVNIMTMVVSERFLQTKPIIDFEEFMNAFVRIGFGSAIKLVSFDESQVVTLNSKFVCGFRNSDCGTRSQSDNTVGSPYRFIIYWIVISKNIKKVTEVIDVKNI
nr:hypothetical protein [Tanacetum cinerariifolium]